MRVAVFDVRAYDERFLAAAAAGSELELSFFAARLQAETVELARDFDAVCVFVNDQLNAAVIAALAEAGVRTIALRCAGFNNVDIDAARAHGMTVVRVPAYSPHAVAEHTVGLCLTLNRKIHRAFNRVREGNFSLDGLLGFDLEARTVGIVGTGRIGQCVAQIMRGFGSTVLAHDPCPQTSLVEIGVEYVELDALWQRSDVITLHCPLTENSHHMVDDAAISQMKRGVMLINTSRGGLIDTSAVIRGLKSGQVGQLALDVYEEEAGLFFRDHSQELIQDDRFARLMTFPNVLITGHQAFFTEEALTNIAETTVTSLGAVARGEAVDEACVVHHQ